VADRNRIKHSSSVADIIGNLIGIGFFLAGYLSITTYPVIPGFIFADGHLVARGLPLGHITVSPQWVAYWQFIMVIAVVEIAFAAANLFQPYWTTGRALLRMVIDLVKTAAFCWLLQSHLLREFVVQGASPDGVAGLFRLSDLAAQYALPFGGAMGLIIVITAIWRMVRQGHPKLSPA
jgi:hypothetical protein